ncbi:MAG: DUF4105 domain-containing protein [Lysobacterales bacterium]
MSFPGWRALALVVLCLAAFAAPAQTSSSASSVPEGDVSEVLAAPAPLQVYLVTVEPGELYWQRFGHNAILLRDPDSGRSVSYNFGYFDFAQQDFLLRFVRGRMLYQAVALDGDADLSGYVDDGRRVWLQELRLDAAAVAILAAYLAEQVRPENRDYRYDYYTFNCSTRVRDALDLALGGALRKATQHRSHGWTYRRFTRAYAQGVPWLYLGTDLALGQPVDQPLSIWDEGFIPGELKRQIRDLKLADGQPLLLSERVLPATADSADIWPLPPDSRAPFAAMGIVLAGLLLALSRLSELYPWGRVALALSGSGLSLVLGAAGLVLAGLWLGTDHAAAWRNENLLLLSPSWWLTLPAWIQLLWREQVTGRTALIARIGAWIAFGLVVFATLSKVFRSFDQSNIEWLLLLGPLVLVMRLVLARRCRAGSI